MGKYIVKINDLYLEWSTVVDAPISWGMTRKGIEKYIKNEYGEQGLLALEKRLARADETGTSALDGTTLASLIAGNHAGPNESELTLEEIYKAYGLGESIRNGWKAAAD